MVYNSACSQKRQTDVHHPLATKCAAFCEFFDLWRAAAGREGEAASPGREHIVCGAARSGERLTTIRCQPRAKAGAAARWSPQDARGAIGRPLLMTVAMVTLDDLLISGKASKTPKLFAI